MKAMVLAAGMGTRLRPLTDDRPKALVELGGRTLLEIVLARLRAVGVTNVIVNTHHFADMVVAYLKQNPNFGMRIELSQEDILLDTGGGLKKAANFFLDSSRDAQDPFILHNVDVLSAIDLGSMMRFHVESNALATLAVQERETSRSLLFDQDGLLCGRRTAGTREIDWARVGMDAQPLAFSGIHVISPRLLAKLDEEGAFSIIAAYLRLAGCGERILGFRADEFYWRDLGRPESILQAEEEVASGRISLT